MGRESLSSHLADLHDLIGGWKPRERVVEY